VRLLGTDIDVVGDDEDDDDDDDDDFVVGADEIVVELEFAIAVVVVVIVSVLLEETFVTDGDVDEIMVPAEDDSFVFDVEETFVVAGVAERDVDSIDVVVDLADVLEAIDVDIVAVVDVAVVDVFVGTILVVTAVVVVAAAAVVVVVVAAMVVVVATVVVVVDKGGAARVGHSRDVHGRVHSQLQAVPVNSQDGFCHVDVNGDVPFAPEPNKNLK